MKKEIEDKWDDLSKQEKRKISLEFLQCEGYDDDGTECETLIEYFAYTRCRHLTEHDNTPYQKGDDWDV